jgi:hypothetical protein
MRPGGGRLAGHVHPGSGRRLYEPGRHQAVGDLLDADVVLSRKAPHGRADLADDAVKLVGGERRPGGQRQHVGGPVGVGPDDQPDAVEQQRVGAGRVAAGQLDGAADVGDGGAHGRVGRQRLDPVQQRLRALAVPGLPEVVGGGDQPPDARLRLGGERGGPLQGGRGRGGAAAPPGALRRALQRPGHVLVWHERGGGQVPGAPVGVLLTRKDREQRLVGSLPGDEGGTLVDGRADQRVTKLQLLAGDPRQPVTLGGLQRLRVHGEHAAGGEHHRQLTGVLRGSDQQQHLGRRRQRHHPLEERPLQLGAQGQPLGQWLGPRQLAVAEAGRQLLQGQRVATGLLDQPVADLRGQLADLRLQHLPGRFGLQSAQVQLRKTGRVELAPAVVAGGQQQHDRFGLQSPRDEHQRIRGRPVQPLRVGHLAQQWLLLGRLGQQAEDTQLDQEPVGLDVEQPERAPKRVGLRGRQPIQVVQDRPQQLVQGGEGKLDLGFDPGPMEQLEAVGLLCRVVQQRALADAGFAANHQHAALPLACTREQGGDASTLGAASVEHGRSRLYAIAGIFSDTGRGQCTAARQVNSAPR